jgi:hypothetical protein
VVYRCDLVEDEEAGEEEVEVEVEVEAANEGERECAGGSKSEEGDEGN